MDHTALVTPSYVLSKPWLFSEMRVVWGRLDDMLPARSGPQELVVCQMEGQPVGHAQLFTLSN